MKKNEKLLLKYFFVIGINEEERKIIIENKKNNTKFSSTPTIISSYSVEGESKLFSLIKENLNGDNKDLENNIFPMKTDYLDIIANDDYEVEQMGNIKSVYSDYIIETTENKEPEHFYHCFQYELDNGKGNDLILNFGVLIFYENINQIEPNEQNNKNNIYIGKALVLISEISVFSLMKEILEKIYIDFIKPKFSFIYLEQFIINCINSLNENNSKIIFNNEQKKENNSISYNPIVDSLLPFQDLNISYFLKIFNIDDILLIAEYYFTTKSILIISPDCELLYPIYHMIMTLSFPFNFHSKNYFYKLCSPVLVQTKLSSFLPSFFFIYTDKNKDNGFINENIIKKIAENLKEVLVFQIKKKFDEEKNEIQFEIIKDIYLYDEKINKVNKKSTKEFEKETIIEKNIGGYPLLLSTIKIQINEINNKVKDLNSKSDFFDLSIYLKLNDLYDSLREKFMGLVIKFFVINIEPFTFKVNDLDKLEIDQIILSKDDKENKMNDFINSEQSDLIYKNDIIKNNKFEIGQIKTIILLDYFIKISKTDKNRLYFEINDQEQKKNKKEIDFEELFNYIKILNNDKKQVNKLKNEVNNFYKIIPFSELKKYISINEDKISKIFGKELNSVIFYNENFSLDFEKLNEEKDNLDLNDNQLSFNLNDIISVNNKENIKYYYFILYEAEIFKKLFDKINTDNRKEYAACYIGLFVSLYILNLLTKLSEDDNNIEENINTLFDKLFELFTKTTCFYGKYNFISTLIYLILSSNQSLKQEYIERFIYSLKELKNVPSIIIFLLYNNSIEFNLSNNDTQGEYKENKINYLKKIPHIHSYDIDSLGNDFRCVDIDCENILQFEIQNNLQTQKSIEYAINPKYLIKEILDKIEEKNSLIIPEICNMYYIQHTSMLDEIYFKYLFFRDDYVDELEY